VRWNLETFLWAIAYTTLGFGAVFLPELQEGTLGLLLAGYLIWAVALFRERANTQPNEREVGWAILALGGIGALEAIGVAMTRFEPGGPQAF
jgi:hypothetical protein